MNRFFGGRTMHNVGRPRKNGLQPIRVLQRMTLALFAYQRARERGAKHSAAVSEAVGYVRRNAPAVRISETEVKRIVAYWRPKGATKCLLVSKPEPPRNITSVPVLRNGSVSFINCRVLYTASHGPRPIYPRANAAEKSA